MKLKEKSIAISLRKKGKSYGEILKKIKVSKSSLNLWLRDLELTPKQKERIYVTLCQKNIEKIARRKK